MNVLSNFTAHQIHYQDSIDLETEPAFFTLSRTYLEQLFP